MSDRNPYEQLGVTEEASFDEIQEAKRRLLAEHVGDKKVLDSIETAYDAILMDRLKMRQEGKITVPERIRFPEKLVEKPPIFSLPPVKNSPTWLQELIDTPTKSEILWSTGVFVVLGGWIAVPGFQESTLSLAIAFGVGFTLYFLNRKERQFGRSLLLTIAGMFLGIGLGTLVASWLPYVTLAPDKIITLVTFLILWLISSFLR